MYLKVEIPGGYFRTYESISNLIMPKGNNAIVILPSKLKESEEIDPEESVEGISWETAYNALPEETQHEVSAALNLMAHPTSPTNHVEFMVLSREGAAYHRPIMFLDKDKVPHFICTQWPAFVCNDEGRTIERI